MSIPRESPKVKLVSSLFSPEEDLIEKVIDQMQGDFGSVDRVSEKLKFDRTKYYAREMGWPLFRRFVSFSRLILPEELPEIKVLTNSIEDGHAAEGKRRINIDPGYLSLERLVLATGKNYIHRIYLNRGIYADLTLVFHAGTFMPLAWTYLDYADEGVIGFFNTVRATYLRSFRGEDEENNA